MVGDPRDVWAYRIAVGALGLAALTALIGAIVILAIYGTGSTIKLETPVTVSQQHGLSDDAPPTSATTTTTTTPTPPAGLYLLGGALAGVLLGILIPLGWLLAPLEHKSKHWYTRRATWVVAVLIGIVAAAVVTGLGVLDHHLLGEALVVAGGGVLLGLLAPSPAIRP